MKALICTECSDIRALPDRRHVAVVCRCGRSAGWWEDPMRGVARFAGQLLDLPEAHRAAPSVRVLGLHNSFLVASCATDLDHDAARELHDKATDAPRYQFDKSRRACWAIVIRPGRSSDTAVVTEAPPGLVDRPDWLPLGGGS